MAMTQKQIVTTASIFFIVLVTAIGGYATSRATRLSLPIPTGLAYATTLLPLISGLLLEAGYDLNRSQEKRKGRTRGSTQRPPLVIVANTFIFIYSTVVITLLGTYAAPPSGLDCGLGERWMSLYRTKNVEAVKTIQDTYACCGFRNSKHMAWPFPDKQHPAPTACEEEFGRRPGCLRAWKEEEKRMAGMLMAVVVLVFLWQVAIIVTPTQRESWLHNVLPDRVSRFISGDDEEQTANESRRAIDFRAAPNRYSDRVEEEDEDEVESGAQRTIEADSRRIEGLFSGGGRRQGSVSQEDVWEERA